MATTHITLSDDNLLAEYVPIEKFKGVLEQRLAIGPDTLAVLIRDGQIGEASAGAHFSIGGVWRTLKDAVGGRHALRLLIADLKPFQLMTAADALTKDNVPVQGEFTIELQVNPEKPANVLGLMKEHSAVTKTSVLNRLTPHLGDRVLNAAVRRVDAVELRGNVAMQDKIQADAMKEVERIASDIGLIARAVSMRWGFNEEENALILKRQQDREQEMLEREFKILNRQVEREAESTVIQLQTDLNVEKVKVSTEDELRRFILSNELNFIDARESGVRIQQMKALEHELHLNRTQRLDGLKALLEAEQHAIEMARTGGQRRGVARDIERDDRKHDVDLTKIGGEKRDAEMDIVERERKHDVDVTKIGGERRDAEMDIVKRERKHDVDVTKIGGERRDAEMDIVTRERKHDVDVARIGGERRDIEMDIVTRERGHDLVVARIRAEMRVVDRSIEDLDKRQALALQKLEEMQRLEIAEKAHEDQIRTLRGLDGAAIDAEARRLDLDIKGGDAAHRRAMEAARLAEETTLSKIQMLKDASPEQIMAINAGFSLAVANVMIEQARAKTAAGGDREALLREMILQAQVAGVANAAQAQHFFDTGMQSNVNVAQGVAQGVGQAAAGRNRPPNPDAARETAECPGCHRTIPVTDRHCRYCGRQMRQ